MRQQRCRRAGFDHQREVVMGPLAVQVSSWSFRRAGFGLQVGARTFQRNRFGAVTALTIRLAWERHIIFPGNRR